MNTPSIAYMLVALCCYQTNIDNYSRKLNLQCPRILERTNIARFYVFGGSARLDGTLETADYTFNFDEYGRLDRIAKRSPPEEHTNLREYQRQLSLQYCALSPDGAYKLAAQWLSAMGVDVVALDRKFHHKLRYPKWDEPVTVNDPTGRKIKTKIVPEFDVAWGEFDHRLQNGLPVAAHVEVNGPSQQLMELSVDDVSLFKDLGIQVPGQLVLEDLPDAPFMPLWNDRSLNATNVFGILRTSAAYQFVMTSRMLAQANVILAALELPGVAELKSSDLNEAFIVPPKLGFSGFIGTKNVAFEFDASGRLKYFFYGPDNTTGIDPASVAYYEYKSHLPLLVNSNNVRELAVGWLKDMRVNIDALNATEKPVAKRTLYKRGHPSHLWYVSWQDPQDPGAAVWIVVDGTTKEPNQIRILKPGYSLGPTIEVGNADELMNIADDAFARYSVSDRGKLVTQFADIK